MSGYRKPGRKKNRRPGDLTEHGRIEPAPEVMARIPEMEAQVFAVGQLGMCQACGVEWGSCHVGVEATVIDRIQDAGGEPELLAVRRVPGEAAEEHEAGGGEGGKGGFQHGVWGDGVEIASSLRSSQ